MENGGGGGGCHVLDFFSRGFWGRGSLVRRLCVRLPPVGVGSSCLLGDWGGEDGMLRRRVNEERGRN